ncbi:MAG: hypothetical protein AB2693_13300, partial [Candidatus Thiodiazotropha sp.]
HENNKATDNTININYEPKQKYRLGTVSNLTTGGLKPVFGAPPSPFFLQWCIGQLIVRFAWKIPNSSMHHPRNI